MHLEKARKPAPIARGTDQIGPDSAKFPVNFPVSREFTVEKGSTTTAPTANHPLSLPKTTSGNIHDEVRRG